MAAQVDIFNLALKMLGATRVSSPTENSKNAKECLDVYDMLRRSELRKKPAWNFAIKNVQLPASSTPPLFDMAYSYPLPSDFIAMHAPFDKANYNDRDWVVEAGQIYTDYGSPINVRYVSDVQDVSKFDPLFVEALAAKIAATISDSITQSNSKMAAAEERYKRAIAEARKANSFDIVPERMPLDTYITVRL